MTLGCEERRFRLVKPTAVKGHFFFCLFFGDTGRFAPDSHSQTVGRRRASVFFARFPEQHGNVATRPQEPTPPAAPAEGQNVFTFESPCAGVRQRDVEDAVPYGMVRKCRRGAQAAGGASPSPTGGCEAVRFRRRGGRPRPPADMEDGRRNGTSGTPSPTGWCENAGVVCRPREGQAPPLRDECEAVGRVRIRGTSRTPSPTGVDRTRSCNLGRLIAAPTSKRKRFSLLLFSVPICGIVSV